MTPPMSALPAVWCSVQYRYTDKLRAVTELTDSNAVVIKAYVYALYIILLGITLHDGFSH